MSAGAPTRVLLLGGSSEIGLAIVRRLARDAPVRPYLLGRDGARLEHVAGELRGENWPDVEVGLVDAEALDTHEAAIATAFERSGGFDLAILAVGILGAQDGLDADPATAAEVLHVNFTGAGSLLMACMRAMRRQGRGTVVVMSSVAAERPRAGNAIYGAAKSGLDALAQGLADAAGSGGPRVLVVRPGFVKTRMTEGLDPAPFATTPEAVAEATVRGLSGRAHTIWVPGKLRVVFAVLRHLPRAIYRRLPL
ncbi:MAG TPA: SDR family NAD(P)-dependent oxidoreductase [Solirubrobacteraceae bacterium]|jgi:decaprenylphospho-beta-D-erythro-pentofuranosid-2-ulose 2-reductase